MGQEAWAWLLMALWLATACGQGCSIRPGLLSWRCFALDVLHRVLEQSLGAEFFQETVYPLEVLVPLFLSHSGHWSGIALPPPLSILIQLLSGTYGACLGPLSGSLGGEEDTGIQSY